MKLYYHPVSTTSRPIMLFARENGIDLKYQLVDLTTGEHMGEDYAAINPNRQVPVLEDGDFRLTESSAILKYLADKFDSPTYPKDLKKRARVNQVMDWLNSNLYKDWGYGLIYPQLFPHHKRPTEEIQAGCIDWARGKSRIWLEVLDQHIIGPENNYLCGNEITIADFFGAPMISLGETIKCDFSPYANISRWLGKMKSLNNWDAVNEIFYGMVKSLQEASFESI